MTQPTPQLFYATQSPISDPQQYANLYDNLPRDIEGISKVVKQLVLHYFGDKWQYDYPPERMSEIDTRYIPSILQRITALDSRPLIEPHAPDKRIVGCCRDFTLLSVSMLRQAGIPARSRHGFGDYFEKGYYMDHVVVEYWNGTGWQLYDTQIPQEHFDFNVTDVPRDRFFVGGKAWQMCRADQADPDRFGLGSVLPIRGWSFIRSRMMQDLAALNKTEMLCWDEWTLDGEQASLNESDLALLDHVADVTQQGDAGFAEVRRLFTDEDRLKLPAVFNSFSPAHPNEELPLKLALV